MRYFLLTLSFLIAFFAVMPAFADDEVFPVKVNGVVVMRLFDTMEDNEQDLSSNAEAVLKAKAGEGADPSELRAEKTEEGVAIYWGSSLVIVVTPSQAKMQSSDNEALAGVWIRNIRKALEVKPLKLSSNKLLIPFGDSDYVTAGESGAFSFSYDKKCLDVSAEGDAVIFTPLRTGEFTVVIKRGRAKGSVKIISKERAGVIAPSISLEVTGDPASSEIIKSAILYRINDAVELKPGASLYLKDELVVHQGLSSGDRMTVPVAVVAEGKGYISSEGTISVSVVNSGIQWNGEGVLWVSNRPEIVSRDGVLFRRELSRPGMARLMYSHKNGSSFHRRLSISFRNNSLKNARMLFRNASAGPDKYEMYAGHKAAVRYMSLMCTGSGYVLDVPPRTTVIMSDTNITPGYLFSGLCELMLLDGDSVEVRVESFPASGKKGRLEDINEPFDPFKIHPHGVFPSSFISMERSFSVSGGDLEVEVGKWPWLIDAETGEPNTGNFGVVYSIDAELVNDTAYPVSVDLLFTPMNGTSQGTIVLDGEIMETPVVKKDEVCRIGKIRLGANERRRVNLMTMPEASSCYPVKFSFSKGL